MPPNKSQNVFKKLLMASCSSGCGCGHRSRPNDPSPTPETASEDSDEFSFSPPPPPDPAHETECSAFPLGYLTKPPQPFRLSPLAKVNESVVEARDSEDPYQDFRASMLQMIVVREIYSQDELRELLRCFLQLNPPRHHAFILQAFEDICSRSSLG